MIISPHGRSPRGRIDWVMSVRLCVRPSVHADISDMPEPISFKLGTRTYTYAIHMHVNFFRDATKFDHVRRIFCFSPHRHPC